MRVEKQSRICCTGFVVTNWFVFMKKHTQNSMHSLQRILVCCCCEGSSYWGSIGLPEESTFLWSGADPRVSANCRLQATSRIYAQNSLTNINYGKRKVLTPYPPETSIQRCLGRDGDDSMASRLVTTPPKGWWSNCPNMWSTSPSRLEWWNGPTCQGMQWNWPHWNWDISKLTNDDDVRIVGVD